MYSAVTSVSHDIPYLRTMLVISGALFAITFLARFTYAFYRCDINLYSTMRTIWINLPSLILLSILLAVIVRQYQRGAPITDRRVLPAPPREHFLDTVQNSYLLNFFFVVGLVVLYVFALFMAVWLGHLLGSVAALPIEMFRDWRAEKRAGRPRKNGVVANLHRTPVNLPPK